MEPKHSEYIERMGEAYIVDGLRTPFGRYRGALAAIRADDMIGHVICQLVARTRIEPAAVDEVTVGCANQAGEDNRNVARMGLLLGGLPITVPGVTVNRLCGSGMQAFCDAARLIQCKEADLVIAGGVEQMSRAPLVMAKPDSRFPRGNQTMFDTTLGWRFINPRMEEMYGTLGMGETAECVAKRYQISREAQDSFALSSQRKAAQAITSGRFATKEVIPIPTNLSNKTDSSPDPPQCEIDEHPRGDITADKLAKLRPAFRAAGSVTAGNCSGLNDGAVAMLVASEAGLKAYNLQPMARYVSSAVCGVDPNFMGLGPIPASQTALERANLTCAEIDIAEINEAFAAQTIPCIQELGLPPDIVNVNGGAIALGHPLGASGARLVITLAHELHLRKKRYGLATMCIGVGQGIAVVVENLL